MILEYLSSKNNLKEDFKKIVEEKEEVEFYVTAIDNSEVYLVTYFTQNNDKSSARVLSNINDEIVSKFGCITLTNESSAYFNKSLFPMINEFERKLRKFLYLKSKLSDNKSGSELIKDLEEMDLGNVFELLFSDKDYVKEVKTLINSKLNAFTKKEAIEQVGSVPENCLWDKIIGENSVKSLKDNFYDLKNYRNNVMHAHNVNYSSYNKALKIFSEVNKELDISINYIMQNEESVSVDFDVIFNKVEEFRSSLRENEELIRMMYSNFYNKMSKEFSVPMENSLKEYSNFIENFKSSEAFKVMKVYLERHSSESNDSTNSQNEHELLNDDAKENNNE